MREEVERLPQALLDRMEWENVRRILAEMEERARQRYLASDYYKPIHKK